MYDLESVPQRCPKCTIILTKGDDSPVEKWGKKTKKTKKWGDYDKESLPLCKDCRKKYPNY